MDHNVSESKMRFLPVLNHRKCCIRYLHFPVVVKYMGQIVVLAHEVKQGLISAVNPTKCSADLSSMPHRVF